MDSESRFQVRSGSCLLTPTMTAQDVSQDSLEFLRRMEHPKHRYRCLSNFHWHHWGRRNGARAIFTDGGASRTVDCIINSFEVAHQPLLLVRKPYIDLWEHLRATFLESNDNDPYHRATIVYGHPGIGKTVSLYYLMCAAAEARIPFVFHRAGDSAAFVCLAAGAFFVPAILVPAIDFLKRALVLIDAAGLLAPDVYDLGPFAHVVLATSQSPAAGRYKGLVKERNARFFTMSLPSLAEFRAILFLQRPGVRYNAVPLLGTDHAVLDVTPSDSDDMLRMDVDLDSDRGELSMATHHGHEYWDPLTVFEHCGPNLRTALAPHRRVTGNPLELLGLANVFDADGFRSFFFERPEPDLLVTLRPPANLAIPTSFLRGVVYAAVRRAQPAQQVELLNRVRRASGAVYELVFEAAMLGYLPTARIVADLPSSATSLVISPHPPPRAYFVCQTSTPVPAATTTPTLFACTGSAEGVESIPDQLGFCALPAGFASAHALMLAEDSSGRRYEILFHVTVSPVSKAHPIAKADMDSLVQALSRHTHTHPPRRLFLFVSDWPEKGSPSLPGADAYPALSGWEIGYVTVGDHDLLA